MARWHDRSPLLGRNVLLARNRRSVDASTVLHRQWQSTARPERHCLQRRRLVGLSRARRRLRRDRAHNPSQSSSRLHRGLRIPRHPSAAGQSRGRAESCSSADPDLFPMGQGSGGLRKGPSQARRDDHWRRRNIGDEVAQITFMHLLLWAEDSEAQLRSELTQMLPGTRIESKQSLALATDFVIAASHRLPDLVFTRQFMPDAITVQADSIRSWASEIFARIVPVLPENAPWTLHIEPHYAVRATQRIGARAWHSARS